MNTAVNEALKRCFAEKRVVFWYDEGGKCRAEFDESEIEGVEKLVIGGRGAESDVLVLMDSYAISGILPHRCL